MLTHENQLFVERAKAFYEEKYRAALEQGHRGEFAYLEPESGEVFLSD